MSLMSLNTKEKSFLSSHASVLFEEKCFRRTLVLKIPLPRGVWP